jgi:hypothetical protein
MSYYDDNFGTWDVRDSEDRQFYRTVQRASVAKRCKGCDRMVRILPHYAYCNSCADAIERGGEF